MTAHKVTFHQTPAFRPPSGRKSSNSIDDTKLYDVIIVGGGLAGMRAGLELATKHPELDFVIFESNKNTGGNAASAQVGNQTVSAGVLYFSEEVEPQLKALDIQAKLRKIPEPAEGGFIDGKFVPGFYDAMRRRLPGFTQFSHDLAKQAKSFGDPITDPALKATARNLDEKSAADFLQQYGSDTKRVLDPYCRAAFGTTTNHISALALLCFFAFEEADKYTIEGGGYGLAATLDKKLQQIKPGSVQTEAWVTNLRNLDDGTVEVTQGGRRYKAKAVVVTTPLAHANKMIEGLSEEKRSIIQSMPELRYLVHNIGPLELDLIKAYTAWTPDSPFPALVNNSWGIKGADYSIRVSDPLDLGVAVDSNAVKKRQKVVFDGLSELFPNIRGMKNVAVQTRVFKNQFPFMGPRFLSQSAPELRKPEGRIVFGGQLIPCVESAFYEAERAVGVVEGLLSK